MKTKIKSFTAKFFGTVIYNEELYIKLENLVRQKENISFMDIKIGTRTFSEHMAENRFFFNLYSWPLENLF